MFRNILGVGALAVGSLLAQSVSGQPTSVPVPPSTVLPITPCTPPGPNPAECPGVTPPLGLGWLCLGTCYDYEMDFKISPVKKTLSKGAWFRGAACDCIYAPLGNPPAPTCPVPGPYKTGKKSQVCWKIGGSLGGTAGAKGGLGLLEELVVKLEVSLSVTLTGTLERNSCTEASAETTVTPQQSNCFTHAARATSIERRIHGTVTVAQTVKFWSCGAGLPSGELGRMTKCNVSTIDGSVDSVGESITLQYTNYGCPGPSGCVGTFVPFTPENDGEYTEPCCPGYLCPCKPPPPGVDPCCARWG
jgi:hypothetical protein